MQEGVSSRLVASPSTPHDGARVTATFREAERGNTACDKSIARQEPQNGVPKTRKLSEHVASEPYATPHLERRWLKVLSLRARALAARPMLGW